MKYFLYFALSALSGCVIAQDHQEFEAFETVLSLDSKCDLIVTPHSKESYEVKTGFDAPKECRIVTHPHTSLVSTAFINGGYIFFIENNHSELESCYSEYTAFKVEKTGDVKIASLVKKSANCFYGKEMKDFEYFSAKINT